MGESELLHRLYTNAAGGERDATGARAIVLEEREASTVVSPEVLAGLDDLLRKTQPVGKETAWAARRFSDSYACVVASYPDLVRDAGGRPGFLNHARLVRVTEPSFDAVALVEAAESFPIGEICATPKEQRLTAYANLVSGEASVIVRPVSAAGLQQLPRTFLEEFLTACLAGCGKNERTPFALGGGDFAMAWAALPFALQRSSSWAVGVESNCPVDAIFSAQGQAPARVASAALVECVKRYVHLLHDAPQEFSAIVRNPNVTTVVKLDEVVKRATIAWPMRAQGAGRGAQEMDMQTKKPRASREDTDPLDADTVAEMKRQYDAMTQSVRDYIDKRIATPEKAVSPIATLWVPAVAILSLLLSGAALFLAWRKPAGATARAPRQTERVETPPPVYDEPEPPAVEENPAAGAVAAAETSGRWPEALRDFLASDSAFAARAISSFRSPGLDTFATRVASRTDLGPDGRERLRALLVAAIAAEQDRNVPQLVRAYGVKSTKTQDLQSELILRWMASSGR